MIRYLGILVVLICSAAQADAASLRFRGGAPITIGGCTKPSAVDFGGNATQCHDAPSNPSYINANFFNDVRQSGQAEYALNASTINYDVTGVHVGAGCDLTKCTINDPEDVSFSASSGSVTGGVLTINPLLLDTNNGNVAIDQYLICTGCPTSPRAKIISQISPTDWQLDQGSLTVSGTPAIQGRRFPQISCDYNDARSGISATPIVYCTTNGDNTTPTLFTGYDMNGVQLRIVAGGGAGANGEAGDITVEHNQWKCNPANQATSISTGINTHFNFYVRYNDHDGMFPTCTSQAFLSNLTVGTVSQSRIAQVEWNVMRNEGVLPMAGSGSSTQGGGYKTYLRVANNVVLSTNLSCTFHGAIYALSLADHMHEYVYEHNTIQAYPPGCAALGTTTMSLLGLASRDDYTNVDTVKFLGNIAIANLPTSGSVACGSSGQTSTETALWQNVGMNTIGTLISRGNLFDNIGATGCAVFTVGASGFGTASRSDSIPGDGLATMNVTSNSGNLKEGAFVHVNNTPFQWCASLTPDGDGETATMQLDTNTAGCTLPAIAAGNGVAGYKMKRGMYISSKIDADTFKVKNGYCSPTHSCSSADLTAPRQKMFQGCTVAAIGATDPETGLPSTGTGMNAGTYVLYCEGADISRNTQRMFGPNVNVATAWDVNNGTDLSLQTGSAAYLGGKDGREGIAP